MPRKGKALGRSILATTLLATSVITTPIFAASEIAPGFYPAVTINLKQVDNVKRVENNPQSDTIITLNPSLTYMALTARAADYAAAQLAAGQL